MHADARESDESRRGDVELRDGGRNARPGDAGGAGGGGAWMRERGAEAGFALNAILSATRMGPVVAPQAQPYLSTVGFVRQLFEGRTSRRSGSLMCAMPPHCMWRRLC